MKRSKTVLTIWFEPVDKERITALAKRQSKSFTALVREWVLERLEDEIDCSDLKKAIKLDDGARYSLDDVF